MRKPGASTTVHAKRWSVPVNVLEPPNASAAADGARFHYESLWYNLFCRSIGTLDISSRHLQTLPRMVETSRTQTVQSRVVSSKNPDHQDKSFPRTVGWISFALRVRLGYMIFDAMSLSAFH
jgi:hypothetical protein